MGWKSTVGSIVAGAFVVLLVFQLLFGTALVNPGERAVVVRNGNVVGTTGSGIHPHLPFATSYKRFDMRQSTYTTSADALTKDNINVNVTVTVRWNIKPGKLKFIYKNVATSQSTLVDRAVKDAVTSGVKTSRQFTSDNLSSPAYRKAIAERIEERFQNRGLSLISVTVENIRYPPEVEQAFRQQQVAEAKLKTQKRKLEAARVENKRQLENARADAKAIQIRRNALSKQYIQFVQAQNIGKADTVYVVPRGYQLGLDEARNLNQSVGNTTTGNSTVGTGLNG